MFKNLFRRKKKHKPYKPLEGERLVLKDHPKKEEESRQLGAVYSALSEKADCETLNEFIESENALNSAERTFQKTEATIKSLAEGKNLLKAEGIKKGKLVKIKFKLEVIANKVELKKMALVALMGADPTEAAKGKTAEKYNHLMYEAHKYNIGTLLIYLIVFLISGATEFVTAKGPLSRVYGEYGFNAVILGLGIVALAYLIKEPMEGLVVGPYTKNKEFRKSMNRIFIGVGIVMLFFGFYTGGEYSKIRDLSLLQDHVTSHVVEDRSNAMSSQRNSIMNGMNQQQSDQIAKDQKVRERNLISAVSKNSSSLEQMQVEVFANKETSNSFMVIIIALMLISGTSFAFFHIIFKILFTRFEIQRNEDRKASYEGQLVQITHELGQLKALREKEAAIEPERLKIRNDRDSKFANYQFDLSKAMYPDAAWEHDKAAIMETKLRQDFPDAFK